MKEKWCTAKEGFRLEYWRSLLLEVNYNICKASRVSGTNRQHIYRLIKDMKLEVPSRKVTRKNNGRYIFRSDYRRGANHQPKISAQRTQVS